MSNRDLVAKVVGSPLWKEHDVVPNERVLNALRKVDRARFLPNLPMILHDLDGRFGQHVIDGFSKLGNSLISEETLFRTIGQALGLSLLEYEISITSLAYNDCVLPLFNGQTCSQPFVVAFEATLAEIEEGMNVLEIGTGCGYSAAVTSYLIGESGRLLTLERDKELHEFGRYNLDRFLRNKKLKRNIDTLHTTGCNGYVERSPFDRIYLTAGIAQDSDLDPYMSQLREGGILVAPEQRGDFIVRKKRGEEYDEQRYGGFNFVPLRKD